MKQIDTDSFQHIKQVRSVRGSRLPKGRALERHEIRSLFSHVKVIQAPKGFGMRPFSGAPRCGLRRSEIVALDMGSMIYKDRALKVLGKGNKERMAYVHGGAWKRLDKWVEEVRGTHEGPLFPRIRRFDDVTGERMSDQAIYHILETRRVEAGLEMFAPHDLRRTFASSMLDNGEIL